MNKYEKIISTVKSETGFLKLIEQGVKPEEIKEGIIHLLKPYFQNKEALEKHAVDHLVPDSVFFIKLRKDTTFLEKFKKCLATYHSAKNKGEARCFEACVIWLEDICDSESKFWSAAHLEVDKCKLELEDCLHECLKNIGEIIEGLTKPYLKVLLAQTRIANGQKCVTKDLDTLELGQIVSELMKKTDCAELFMPRPWNISLSQWRNIAYHHSAKIKDDRIVCWWGRKPNIRRIELSRGEMLEVVSKLFAVYGTLKLVHTFFFIDNSNAISKLPITCERQPREESELLNFVAGLATQGFEVVELKRTADEAKAVIKDVSDLDLKERRAHTTQFLFPLWLATRSKKLVIEYRRNDNKPDFLITTDSKTCERIYAGEEDTLTLAKRTEMVDLKTGKIISRWRSK